MPLAIVVNTAAEEEGLFLSFSVEAAVESVTRA